MNRALRLRRTVRWIVWTPLIAGGLVFCGVSLGQTIDNHTLPACETEDAQNCYWDAQERGNGQGESFVDIRGERYPR